MLDDLDNLIMKTHQYKAAKTETKMCTNLAQFVPWQFVDVETELPLLIVGHGGRLHLVVAVDGPRLPQRRLLGLGFPLLSSRFRLSILCLVLLSVLGPKIISLLFYHKNSTS